MGQRILVTGAGGFLGSHLCDALLDAGWTVVGLDNLSQGQERNLAAARSQPGFSLEIGDVRDPELVLRAAAGADVIAHLAAYKIPRYGGRLATLDVNAQGTRAVLEAARQTRARVLFASTSDCYGKNPRVPFNEGDDSVLGPASVARWAYAVSKSFCEHLCFGYREEHGVATTVVRFFGSYGPRHHLSWWGGPQSVFIDLALQGKPLVIHGDGLQTRSFTYVEDTVAGIMALLEARLNESDGEVFNIGTDHEITIADLGRLVYQLVRPGKDPLLDFVPYQEISGRPYEDVRRRVPNTDKLRRLGWRPAYTLEAGLTETVAWQRQVRLEKAG